MRAVIIFVSLLCLSLIGLAWYFGTRDSNGGPRLIPINESYTKRQEIGGWVKGSENPTVKIIEYSDFQCPACAAIFPVINGAYEITKEYTQLTYRQYPLIRIHNKSNLAAWAAEAAGRQGKFWQMHDLLFNNQPDWESDTSGSFNNKLVNYAKEIGLNVDQFRRDLTDQSIQNEIDKDVNSANQQNISATPTLYINGEKVEKIPTSTEEFVKLIEKYKQQ